MSKVRLRSRCYRLSRADCTDICNPSLFRHNLRSNDDKNETILTCASQCNDTHQIAQLEESAQLNLFKLSTNINDKSLDNSLVETSSLESQSTSQMSSNVSLESIDFCKWEDCGHDFLTNTNHMCHKSGSCMADELEKHLLEYHVKSQVNSKRKYFQCLWSGCKVYKQKSLSYSWLERHVVDHTDNRSRPFSCIFNCHQRFASQPLLEKHVQIHIDALSGTHFGHLISSDLNSNLRSRKTLLINKKPNKQLNSYHVNRPDFIDFNIFNQIQMNNSLQRMKIPFDMLDRFDLTALHDKPIPEVLLRLLTVEFKVMGKRIYTGYHNETLIEWIQPYNLRTHSEWIDESLLQLAECLSQDIATR